MFFDRLKREKEGITAFLKYPLRLLAVQQLDRVLTDCNQGECLFGEEESELRETTPFKVGFFV